LRGQFQFGKIARGFAVFLLILVATLAGRFRRRGLLVLRQVLAVVALSLLLDCILSPLVSSNLLVFCLVEVLSQNTGENKAKDVNTGHADNSNGQFSHVLNNEVHHQSVTARPIEVCS